MQTIDIKEVKQEVVDKMEQYKQEFIEFMVESDVLKFGEFTLKSGQQIPIFYECRSLCDRFTVNASW